MVVDGEERGRCFASLVLRQILCSSNSYSMEPESISTLNKRRRIGASRRRRQRQPQRRRDLPCSLPAPMVGAVLIALVYQASGFTILTTTPTNLLANNAIVSSSSSSSSLLQLSSSNDSTSAAVQRLQPRTETDDEKRQRAYSAMKRNRVESALTPAGVDARMLELLSDQFLYPNNSNSNDSNDKKGNNNNRRSSKRPKGRPEYVPGAMNYETLIKFRERQDVLDLVAEQKSSLSGGGSGGADDNAVVSEQEIAAIAPYLAENDGATISNTDGSMQHLEEAPAKNDRPKRNGVKKQKGSSSPDAPSSSLPVVDDAEASSSKSTKKRKRVSKNLPPPRKRTDKDYYSDSESQEDGKRLLARKTKGGSSMDLHKYYRTKLLTADQEYALGMKIQFMMKCEHVHEGLAAHLMRLPTFEEWAEACGFVDPDPTFVATEADEQLRPVGSEAMFEETDPNMFVGNGLAHNAGPGRGRGRTKKPPPLKLEDFYDDSEYQRKKRSKKTKETAPPRKEDLKPINRGTPTDFVEMMMTAREAKQQMVQSNMRLVVSIARKYSNVGVSLQDLVQEGSLGLSRAAEKFQPKKGFKFSTYASWWIQQAVFRSIAYHSRTIRLPVHVHNLLNRIRKVKNALQHELNRAPTNEEIAEQLGMTVQKYNKMLHLTKRSISLETPKYQSNPKDLGHESEDLLGDTIASNGVLLDESSPEKKVDHSLFQDDLKEMLQILEEDERRVICARYGLSDGLTRTVTAVAAQMKQSKAWVRSQECRALRKLRRPWYEKKLKEHQDALTN